MPSLRMRSMAPRKRPAMQLDIHAGPQDVVAAAVEADDLRAQVDGRLQLLVDDRNELAAADGEVGVRDGAARGRRRSVLGESDGDEVGPAAHGAVGLLVADALGEAVSDGHVTAEHVHSPISCRLGRAPVEPRPVSFAEASRSQSDGSGASAAKWSEVDIRDLGFAAGAARLWLCQRGCCERSVGRLAGCL